MIEPPAATVPAEPPSAAPSIRVRAIAFGAIWSAGMVGTLAGYRLGVVECRDCTGTTALYMVIGALAAALGAAIVAAITLRAHTEGY